MSRLDESRLENIVRRGERIVCRCPACFEEGHDKSGNHLSVFASGAFACVQFPGEAGKDHRKRIFALVGIKDKKRGARRYETLEQAVASMELELKMRATRRDPYDERYFMVRFDDPEKKREKELRPFHFDGKGWVIKDPKGLLPLFRKKELLASDSTQLVFIPEGEKCVCAMEGIGVLAVTSAHGAQVSAQNRLVADGRSRGHNRSRQRRGRKEIRGCRGEASFEALAACPGHGSSASGATAQGRYRGLD